VIGHPGAWLWRAARRHSRCGGLPPPAIVGRRRALEAGAGRLAAEAARRAKKKAAGPLAAATSWCAISFAFTGSCCSCMTGHRSQGQQFLRKCSSMPMSSAPRSPLLRRQLIYRAAVSGPDTAVWNGGLQRQRSRTGPLSGAGWRRSENRRWRKGDQPQRSAELRPQDSSRRTLVPLPAQVAGQQPG